jgi:hypothetical protein
LLQHYFDTHIKQENTFKELNILHQNINNKILEISEQLSNNNKPSNKSALLHWVRNIKDIPDKVKSLRQLYNEYLKTYPNENQPLEFNTDYLDKILNDWHLMLEERSKYVEQLADIENNSQDLKKILDSIKLNTGENLKNNKAQIEQLLLQQKELLQFKSDELNCHYNTDMIEQINSAINNAQDLQIQCANRLAEIDLLPAIENLRTLCNKIINIQETSTPSEAILDTDYKNFASNSANILSFINCLTGNILKSNHKLSEDVNTEITEVTKLREDTLKQYEDTLKQYTYSLNTAPSIDQQNELIENLIDIGTKSIDNTTDTDTKEDLIDAGTRSIRIIFL